MKRFLLFIFLGAVLTGCNTEFTDEGWEPEAAISGKGKASFSGATARNATASVLEEGTTLSLFSRNGITAENQELTLTGNNWESHPPLRWERGGMAAEMTAYSPAFPSESSDFYASDGRLKDLLFCKGSFSYLSDITLHFNHFFAQIQFEVAPMLNEVLKTITFTPSQKIKAIEPHQAEITLAPSDALQQVCCTKRENACYSLLVPPSPSLSLIVQIETTAGNILQKEIPAFQCLSGHSYRASIQKKSQHIGIYDVEEFIAFTHLVNQLPYKGYKLSDFGETLNGVTTYYLKADLHFTEGERKSIQPIGLSSLGSSQAIAFNDVFDGQNHLLHNLWIESKNTEESGLFLKIGANGAVMNLQLANSTAKDGTNVGTNALLCGFNAGVITNCHIKNSSLVSANGDIGSLVGINKGRVQNSSVQGLDIDLSSLKKPSIACGGLCTYNTNSGKILNCYCSGISLHTNSKLSSHVSAVSCNNEGIIENCYSNLCDKKVESLCRYNTSDGIGWCYYPKDRYNDHLIGKGSTYSYLKQKHVIAFTETPESKQGLTRILNQWVLERGTEMYPDSHFFGWKMEPDLTVLFDSL